MKRFLYTTLVLITLHATNALAQLPGQQQQQAANPVINQYDPKYKVKPIIVQTGQREVIPQNKIGVYFVRDEIALPGTATLRLASPVSVNGCFTVIQPPPILVKEPPFLRIIMQAPSIQTNTEFENNLSACEQPPKLIYTDVVLDSHELITENIRTLSFKTDILTEDYSIDVNNQRIMLFPESQIVFRPQSVPGKSNPLEYWFYPKNTILLSVPKSTNADETYALLKPLANEANLITLGSVLPDFAQNFDTETRFYFVDETGKLKKEMGEKNSIPFGKIEVTRTYTGINGHYDINESLNVFAMKPGYYD